MSSIESLINELEEIKNRTDLPLERRLIDTAVWFHSNKDRISKDNLGARLEFNEKALDIFIEMMAMIVQRLQVAEGRSSSLYLPRGMSVGGSLKHFG